MVYSKTYNLIGIFYNSYEVFLLRVGEKAETGDASCIKQVHKYSSKKA